MMNNTINLTDGYKLDHRRQYPEGTTKVVTNYTSRKTRREGVTKLIHFGLQYFLKKYLIEEFNKWFALPKEQAVKAYTRRINNYLPLGHGITFEHIVKLHDLGYLPIEVRALPEGAQVPIKVPIYMLTNTLPEFFWLVNYLETLASCSTWPMNTSATTAFQYKKLLIEWARKTGGDEGFVPFQGHDFSFRGMFGVEAACMSGAAHLTSFVGTDTIPAIDLLEEYYGADSDKELVGASVAATEHSVMCLGTGLYIYEQAGGNWNFIGAAEESVFRRLITEVYPTGIVSIVSDTFDLWKVLTKFLPELKEEILARDGKVVIRPDSGDPVDILCGSGIPLNSGQPDYDWANTPDYKDWEPDWKGVVQLLWDTFGGTETDKGYKLLDPHIGCIYGDSINLERANNICQRLADKGFASTNWVAGIGSFTYQYVTRDTDGSAMKATYGEVTASNGKTLEIPIFKDPITDDGTKKSARGLISVCKDADGQYTLKDQCTKEEYDGGELAIVFKDSRIIREFTLSEVRENIAKELNSELAAK